MSGTPPSPPSFPLGGTTESNEMMPLSGTTPQPIASGVQGNSSLEVIQTESKSAGNERKIILIIEATPALGNRSSFIELYNTYLTNTLQKLLSDVSQKTDLALITFQNYPPHGECVVRVSSFTTDVKEFGYWIGSIPLLVSGDSTPPAMVEGLCAALKMCRIRKAKKETHVILITNSPPNSIRCRSCPIRGDCFDHAEAFGKEEVFFSILALQEIEELRLLYEKAGIGPTDGAPQNKGKDKNHLALLRGNLIEIKSVWQGTLQLGELISDLVAYVPSTRTSELSTTLWPSKLTAEVTCSRRDFTQYLQSHRGAPIEFHPVKGKPESNFKNIYQHLQTNERIPIVHLTANKYLLLAPKQNQTSLIGILILKS